MGMKGEGVKKKDSFYSSACGLVCSLFHTYIDEDHKTWITFTVLLRT